MNRPKLSAAKDWKTAVESKVIDNSHETLVESQLFSPRHRPNYPRLMIIDDGTASDGEEIRIRCDSLTIGRSGCDICFPADGLMSSKHIRISLKQMKHQTWAWVIDDLDSKNGLFIRQLEIDLNAGNEFLMGGVRYLLHAGHIQKMHSIGGNPSISAYVAPSITTVPSEQPRGACLECREYSVPEHLLYIPLSSKPLALGRAATGPGRIPSDPFLEPLHAKLLTQDQMTWRLIDQDSTNGIWLRIKEAVLHGSIDFFAGEQRFRFTIT